MDIAHGHSRAAGLDFKIAIGRGLDRLDKRRSGLHSLEAAEFLRRKDNNLVATVNGHMLGALAADAPDEFAETGLGIL